MKATKQFIEDAIEGGWNPRPEKTKIEILISPRLDEYGQIFTIFQTKFGDNGRTFTLFVEQILFDPQAWQAVGKTRGWETYVLNNKKASEWKFYQFLDEQWNGKTIDEALQAIE